MYTLYTEIRDSSKTNVDVNQTNVTGLITPTFVVSRAFVQLGQRMLHSIFIKIKVATMRTLTRNIDDMALFLLHCRLT